MRSSNAAISSTPPSSVSSRRSKNASAFSSPVCVAAHAGPPSANHTLSTHSRRAPGRLPKAISSTLRRRSKRSWAAAPRLVFRRGSFMNSHTVPRLSPAMSALNSSRLMPHHGARRTASHAMRSAGCSRARVSEVRSWISGTFARESISTARNRIPASRSAGRMPPDGCGARDQNRDLAGISLPGCADEFDHPRRFGLHRRVPRTGAASPRGRARGDGPNRTANSGSRRWSTSSSAARTPGKVSFTHSTMPRSERKLAVSRRSSKRQAADPFAGRFQKQPDLGLAKAIDGLHRVAHRERRPAIVPLPARSELLDEGVLADRSVLEFVDQQMLDLVVQASARSVGSSGSPSARCAAMRDLWIIGLCRVWRNCTCNCAAATGSRAYQRFERLPLRFG